MPPFWLGAFLGFVAGGLFWAAVLLFVLVLEKVEEMHGVPTNRSLIREALVANGLLYKQGWRWVYGGGHAWAVKRALPWFTKIEESGK